MSTARRKVASTLVRSAALSVAAVASSSPRRYSTTLQGVGGTGYRCADGVQGTVCKAQGVQVLGSLQVAAGGSLQVAAGGSLQVAAGGSLQVAAGGCRRIRPS